MAAQEAAQRVFDEECDNLIARYEAQQQADDYEKDHMFHTVDEWVSFEMGVRA